MIEKQKKDRHHFISQFYLKPFADIKKGKGDDEYIVQVLDKTNANIYPKNVSRVAYAHQFNRLESFRDDPNELEDLLADIEGKHSINFKRLIESRCLDEKSTNAAVNLMALFASRRPKGREHIQAETYSVESALYSALYHNPELSANRSDGVTHDMIRQAIEEGQAKPTVYTKDRFIQTEFVLVRDTFRDLSKRIWHVLDCSHTNVRFITSDNPVILFTPGQGFSPLNFAGILLNKESIVYFPVSPELALYGVLSDKAPPEMLDEFAAELNTWMVNFSDERLIFNSNGFKVIDNDGALNSEEDVQRACNEWLETEKKRGG